MEEQQDLSIDVIDPAAQEIIDLILKEEAERASQEEAERLQFEAERLKSWVRPAKKSDRDAARQDRTEAWMAVNDVDTTP